MQDKTRNRQRHYIDMLQSWIRRNEVGTRGLACAEASAM